MWFPPTSSKILLIEIPLSEKSEKVFSYSYDDKILNEFIDNILGQLEEEKIECFKRDNNVIVTEKGYYVALYEGDERIKKLDNAS